MSDFIVIFLSLTYISSVFPSFKASALQCPWCVLSWLCDGANKRDVAANQKDCVMCYPVCGMIHIKNRSTA